MNYKKWTTIMSHFVTTFKKHSACMHALRNKYIVHEAKISSQ